MKQKKVIILLIFLSLIIITIFNMVNYKYKHINYDNVDNIMIVAHPDDETLWGGAHLLNDHYLVICITCGSNLERVSEFKKVMKYSNSEYLMLNYPDKTFNKRNNWSKIKDNINNDLTKILLKKEWKMIVTHNIDGEYGHIHHKMTNKIVTDIVNKHELDNLYYFHQYYSKLEAVNNDSPKISVNDYKKKREMLKLYQSQKKTINKFEHMNYYEDFQKYGVKNEKIN
ncbi:MAG: PIG-L family deacetylase [Bacilli bacterium]